jgi:hypothetical protein
MALVSKFANIKIISDYRKYLIDLKKSGAFKTELDLMKCEFHFFACELNKLLDEYFESVSGSENEKICLNDLLSYINFIIEDPHGESWMSAIKTFHRYLTSS